MIKYAIIVAGGSGSRINSEKPKQFLLLGGKPILIHTLERFYSADHSINLIVVLPEKEIPEWESLCSKYNFEIPHHIVIGGETRFHSVKNGLGAVKEKGIVAVHDGVRPFASVALINKCFDEAEKYGNAVPNIPVAESIRIIAPPPPKGGITHPSNPKTAEESGYPPLGGRGAVDRNSVVIIQTPQCFDSEILKKGYTVDFKDAFTDDASVVEHLGHNIHLIEGEKENIKITYPFDLKIAEAILNF